MRDTLLPLLGLNVRVQVHPVVLLSICDAYIRRNDKQERVIGTLLGSVADGVAQVQRCYVVPHNESADQVAVDIVHHKTMLDLHQKVAPQQVIVGWFSTTSSNICSDALIQDFYAKEPTSSSGPIHLVLDTSLAGDHVDVRAYASRALSLGDKTLATEFVELPCEVLMGEAERVGLNLLVSGDYERGRPLSDAEGLPASIARLQQLLGTALGYVEDVVAGRAKADPAIGRHLADTLAAIPRLEPSDFERLFNEGIQDQLLVDYFANLVRTQVALAERLGTAALPLV